MKTNDELDDLARQIYLEYDSDDLPAARKLLRSVRIDVLRESREIVERRGDDDLGHAGVLKDLDALIRKLELT